VDSLSSLRVDLARRSKWNIGYLVAGFVYWSFAAITGTMLPMASAKMLWMAGGFTIFPMAIGFSYALRSDPFCKGNPLGSLMGLAHGGMIVMSIPLLIALMRDNPTMLPLCAAILFGASFTVLSWAFGDPIFLAHIIVRVVGVTAIWFAMPAHRFSVLPASVAALYLMTFLLLPARRQRWMDIQSLALADRPLRASS
jgi:hypothetical protein